MMIMRIMVMVVVVVVIMICGGGGNKGSVGYDNDYAMVVVVMMWRLW